MPSAAMSVRRPGRSSICNLQFAIFILHFAYCRSAPAAQPPAVTIDAGRFAAAVSAIDAQQQITFRTEPSTRIVAAADLVSWGSPVEPPSRTLIVLAGGGILVAEVTASDPGQLRARSAQVGPVTLPRDAVSGIIFQPPADRRRADALVDRLIGAAAPSDRLLLANSDELSGTVEGLSNQQVDMRADMGLVSVKVDRLTAVIFRHAAPPPPAAGLRLWTGLADGSRLLARQVRLDQKALRVTLGGGTQLTAEPDALVWLAPVGGRAVYLSDLPTADYRHVAFLDLVWPYRTDHSVTGAWLRAGGRPYAKGLGVHSAARLTYNLTEPYRRFEAQLAIDDDTAGGGSVRFRVFVDGKAKYTSPIIRGHQPPLPVAVDLEGGRRLDLVVDFADRADQLDHADWLDARVEK